MDLAIAAGLAVAATGLLSLGWAIVSFFLRRDFSDLVQLNSCLRGTPASDPLHYAFSAALYERLYRFHYPARRDLYVLWSIWLWSVVLVLPFSAKDVARYFPPDKIWVALLGMQIALAVLIWTASRVTWRLRETFLSNGDEAHRRYRNLFFSARAKFLEMSAEAAQAPERLPLGGWPAAIFGPRKRKGQAHEASSSPAGPALTAEEPSK